MKLLSSLVEEYRQSPNEELKSEIFERVISLENLKVLDLSISINKNSKWIVFDNNIRIKQKSSKKFVVADVFHMPTGGYVCYTYEINLAMYTEKRIQEYESFSLQYKDKAPNSDFFSAFSIAKATNAEEKSTPVLVTDEEQLKKWYEIL